MMGFFLFFIESCCSRQSTGTQCTTWVIDVQENRLGQGPRRCTGRRRGCLIRETKSALLVYTNKTKAVREHNCCL